MRTNRTFRHALTTTAAAATAAAGLVVPATPVSALPMTFVVDTLSDNPADGDTLREMIDAANANAGHDTIEFADGLTGTITMLGATDMNITESLDIVGPGSDRITIDADGSSRVLRATVANEEVSISGLTLVNGAILGAGGAMWLSGLDSVTISDVVVTDSAALQAGAIQISNTVGKITISDSRFERNSGGLLGGAVFIEDASNGEVWVEDSVFVDNQATEVGALGIKASNRSAIVHDSDFTGNSATGDVGAVAMTSRRGLVRINSTFTDNTSGGSYGALWIETTTELAGVSGSTFTDNIAAGTAGAARIESAAGDALVDGTFIGNSADSAGAVYVTSPATIDVRNARFEDNTSVGIAGALVATDAAELDMIRTTIADNSSAVTGGVYLSDVDVATIDRSTFFGNTSTNAVTGGSALGVSNAVMGDLGIFQSTFSGNESVAPGGAIRTTKAGTEIWFSTIVGNHSDTEAGFISTDGFQPVSIHNSILADNTAPVGPTVNEAINLDYSIVTDNPGGFVNGANNQFGVDPDLGPLADNDGGVLTHLPDVDSPAVDAADPTAGWLAGSNDQRGWTRPVGRSDIGSVEVQAPVWIPVTPARFVDTRASGVTVDGQDQADGAFAIGEQRTYSIAGRGDVPADAIGVIANLTAVGPQTNGYLTAHPCVSELPLAASLNYTTGVNLGNEIIIGLDEFGDLCIFSSAASQLTVDVVGYIPALSNYVAKEPQRFLDTRATGETFDDEFEAGGMPGAGEHVQITVGGRGKVGVDSTVVMYVAAVNPTATGFLTIWDCVGPMPLASSLNHVAGVNRGNEVLAKTGPDGEVCIFTSQDVHVTADVVGHVPQHQNFTALDQPARVLDTRAIGETVDDAFEAGGATTPGGTLMLDVAGRAGVPADATTVAVNLTAVAPPGVGYVTAHPCGVLPNAASLNHVAGVNGGNEIIAELDANGRICLFTSAAIQLTADVTGYTRG